MTLRVSSLDGSITLTVPKRVRERELRAFLEEREGWLREATGRIPDQELVRPGSRLPVDGRAVEIVVGEGHCVVLNDTSLLVPGPPERMGARVLGWLKTRARDIAAEAADRYAAEVGRPVTRLTLRDTRSRWGSCTSEGHVMLSWRLAMAPRAVFDYVIAHEVAHLVEMNHSSAYWAVVDRLYPGWEAQRSWLRREGASLHRYRFTT